MKCLLVDDEPGIREGLAALLRRKGHDVRTAADCAAAATALASDEFDVVVTDWHLPDGLASAFVGAARCPVLTVSGHPEEVDVVAPIVAVLTKPVQPKVLIEALAAAATTPQPAAMPELPRDVQRIVDSAIARLPHDALVELIDDGHFVTLKVELPDARPLALRSDDGDLRVRLIDGRRRAELRLLRDGRPDPSLPVVTPTAVWPRSGDFAVDFAAVPAAALPAPELLRLLDRTAAAQVAGQRVHFLNVPPELQQAAESQGRAHDMPMRAPVGPRLQPELADLWSTP